MSRGNRRETTTRDEFVRHYPVLYHITEASAWPSILDHGLESTSELLDRFGVAGPERVAVESCRRATSLLLRHGVYPEVRLSDHKPINLKMLARCLSGTPASDWFGLLNERVFFWPASDRLGRHLKARLGGGSDQAVLVFESAPLIDRCGDAVRLSPMNSGCTRPPQPRGAGTFLALADYPFDDLRRKRGATKAVAEATVLRRVDSVRNLANYIEVHTPAGTSSIVWAGSAQG